ncbi:MAG: hypothetical protein M1594_02700 [Candidatus Marsarchaeota archaeon]|nr:hypothetical protein [Candidatus Marsarchaeota archaeon]
MNKISIILLLSFSILVGASLLTTTINPLINTTLNATSNSTSNNTQPLNQTNPILNPILAYPTISIPIAVNFTSTGQIQSQGIINLMEEFYQYNPVKTKDFTATTLQSEQIEIQNALEAIDEAFYNQSQNCRYALHPLSNIIAQIKNNSFENQSFQQLISSGVQFNSQIQSLDNQTADELRSAAGEVLAKTPDAVSCAQNLITINTTVENAENRLKLDYEVQKNQTWSFISNETTEITSFYVNKIERIHPINVGQVNQTLEAVIAEQNSLKIELFIEKLKLLFESLEIENFSMQFNSSNQIMQLNNETAVLNGSILKIKGFKGRFHNSTIVAFVDLNILLKKNMTGFYFNISRENQTNDTGFEKLLPKNLNLSQPLLIIKIDQNLSDDNIQNATFSINFSKQSLDGSYINTSNIEIFRNHNGSLELLNYTLQDEGDYYILTFTTTGLSVFAAYMVNVITTPNPSNNPQSASSSNPSNQNSGLSLGTSFWSVITIIAIGGMGTAYFLTRKKGVK